jgi:predicted outer membrane repeat protein
LEGLEDRCLLASILVLNPHDYEVVGQLNLRQAIELANSSAYPGEDVISFGSGLTGMALEIQSELPSVTDALVITGWGADPLTIRPADGVSSRILMIGAGVDFTASDLTFARGSSDAGGAILNQGNAQITRCVFMENTATYGGGAILSEVGSALTITDCRFWGNTAGYGGAIAFEGSSSAVATSEFSHNFATDRGGLGSWSVNGGALYNTGLMTLADCRFTWCAAVQGGAIYNAGGLELGNVTISQNRAVEGGGVWNGGTISSLASTMATLNNNTAQAGGGGMAIRYGGSATLSALFESNTAMVGGGLYVEGSTATLRGRFGWNRAAVGGALATVDSEHGSWSSHVHLDGSVSPVVFHYNVAENLGGAIANQGSEITGTTVRFENNASHGSGGAIEHRHGHALASMTLTRAEFTWNSADVAGGAIDSSAPLELNEARFESNLAFSRGGAIASTSSLMLKHAVLRTNRAGAGGGIFTSDDTQLEAVVFDTNQGDTRGGGLSCELPGFPIERPTVNLANCSFYNNSSPIGGGIWNRGEINMSGGRLVGNIAYIGAGGGARNEGSMVLDGVAVSRNHGSDGGGISTASSGQPASLDLRGCSIVLNDAGGRGGGVDCSGAEFSIRDTTFDSNRVFVQGGGLALRQGSRGEILNSRFINNQTQTEIGGGVVLLGSFATLRGCTFEANSAMSSGGAIYTDQDAVALIQGSAFQENEAYFGLGGALYNDGYVNIEDTAFRGNRSAGSGGAVQNHSEMVILRCGFWANETALGGGLANSGEVTVVRSHFEGNHASYGGGIESSGHAVVRDSSFVNNSASAWGGAVANGFRRMELRGCTFTGNTAEDGGAIVNTGDMLVNDSAFRGNWAMFTGGAFKNTSEGDAQIINCGFDGNEASLGGALENLGVATVVGGRFVRNSAAVGGAIESGGAAYLTSVWDSVFINNAAAYSGGAVANSFDVTELRRCVFEGNTASDGGAIVNAGELLVSESQLTDNHAETGGAVSNIGRYCLIDASVFDSNASTLSGGAVSNAEGSEMRIQNGSVFRNNNVVSGGGGAVENGGFMIVAQASFVNNSANFGGAIDASNQATETYLGSCVMSGNHAFGAGGAIYNGTQLLVIDGCTLISNTTQGDGGAIVNWGETRMNMTMLEHNEAQCGGAVLNAGGRLLLAGVQFKANTASIAGGAICIEGGAADLLSCSLYRNVAGHMEPMVGPIGAGGGIVLRGGSLNVVGTTFLDNEAFFNGGGLSIQGGDARITSSTLMNNFTIGPNGQGGGIDTGPAGELTMINCTLFGNRSDYGGGMTAIQPLTLVNCTLSGNHASVLGGGIASTTMSMPVLVNTIVAKNASPSGPDVYGPVRSVSVHNLIGDGRDLSGIVNGLNGNQVGTASAPIDPLLDAPAYHGGTVLTMALLPGSPAINGGTTGPLVPGYDARGAGRVNAPDIGAFEAQVFVLEIHGGSGQWATVGTAFELPLKVEVRSVDEYGRPTGDPVAGGYVTFTPPHAGATAVLATSPALIGTDGMAQVWATAGSIAGKYGVVATARGADAAATFTLTNLPHVTETRALWGALGSIVVTPGKILSGIHINRFVLEFDQPFADMSLKYLSMAGVGFGNYLKNARLVFDPYSTSRVMVELDPLASIGGNDWDIAMRNRGDRIQLKFGAYGLNFAALPGDVRQDGVNAGVVNRNDYIAALNAILSGYDAMADVDGDGVVTNLDAYHVLRRINRKLI